MGETSRPFLLAEIPCGALTRDLGQDFSWSKVSFPSEFRGGGPGREASVSISPCRWCGMNYSPCAKQFSVISRTASRRDGLSCRVGRLLRKEPHSNGAGAVRRQRGRPWKTLNLDPRRGTQSHRRESEATLRSRLKGSRPSGRS